MDVHKYKYYYKATKESVAARTRYSFVWAGEFVGSNEKLEMGVEKEAYLYRGKGCKKFPSYPNGGIMLDGLIEIGREEFLDGLNKLGVVVNPKIGDLVKYSGGNEKGQIIDIHRGEALIEQQVMKNGVLTLPVFRMSLNYLIHLNGIYLDLYKGGGSISFNMKESTELTTEKIISPLLPIREVDDNRTLNGLKREVEQLKDEMAKRKAAIGK